ncbi:MAG: putative LPS assembly protein LptD, partial [Bacteroidota bacterium]|nr:putative LPS assembly protein LptD [Bacteroidota bacterium]
GSWGLTGRTNYRVKYKYSGSFNASYLETVTSEKNLPDYAKAKNFNLTWSHSQDAKANPYRTFSASVNFATSGYARSDLKSYYNPEAFSSNTKSSSINMSQRFGDSPFSANMSMNITQRSKDSTLSVSLPSLTISMSSINPFKRKNAVGNPRWYEDIRLGYTGSFANSISEVKEDQFLHKSLIKDWKNGAQHNLSLSSKFNLLNYVTVTPSVNYTERWYSSSIRKNFDQATNKEVTDTIWGFNRVWDYSASLTADTKLYGMYTPVRKIFGNKIGQIRHVITPSISYNYKPDFGAQRYGYYDDYSYTDTKGVLQTVTYSRYANSLYGSPSAGKSGSIGFNVINNLEMKLNQPTDTGVVEKKVSLIDLFQFGSSYNLAADSLNWSDISVALRLKFGKKYTLNLSTSLDPYMYQLNSSGNPVKVNETTFAKLGIPGRLTSTGTSFSYSISNETFKKKEKKTNGDTGSGSSSEGGEAASDGSAPTGTGQAPPAEQKPLDPEEMLYQPFKMPWSINFSYSLRYGRYTFNKEKLDYNYKLTQNLSLSGNISLYDKWKFTASTSYNFEYKQFATMNCTVSRDLHCWEMSASFIPIGPYKSYNFSIRVKSSLLQDLKYEQHQNPRDNYIWGN